MQPIHHLLLALLLAFGLLAGAASAADPAPSPPAVKNPLEDETPNPLTEPDPFAGEYEGDEVIVVIKVSGDGYGGEIRRAGRIFPIKAARDGKVVTGTFSHESTTFKFTAQFEGQALKLASGNKVFLLKRKDAAVAAVPTPALTPQPPTTPAPPRPTPAPAPPPIPVPPPAPPEPTQPAQPRPAALPLPVNFAGMTSQRLADVVWSRFSPDAYVVIEDVAGSSRAIGSIVRKKHVLAGVADGKPLVRGFRWNGTEWGKAEPPAPPQDDCLRPDELGYTKGQKRTEKLTVAGKSITCDCTTYTTEIAVKDGRMKLSLDVWRSLQIDHPPSCSTCLVRSCSSNPTSRGSSSRVSSRDSSPRWTCRSMPRIARSASAICW